MLYCDYGRFIGYLSNRIVEADGQRLGIGHAHTEEIYANRASYETRFTRVEYLILFSHYLRSCFSTVNSGSNRGWLYRTSADGYHQRYRKRAGRSNVIRAPPALLQ